MTRAPRLATLLLSISLWLAACGGDPAAPGAPRSSDPAPDFTLTRLADGGELSLASLRGKTVLIDFWATWCGPCEDQVPVLNAFFDAHREDSDVVVLGISVDTDGPDVVAAWVSEMGVRYPILLGDEDLARRYGALGFPALVVVSPDGEVQERHLGRIQADALEAALSGVHAG